MRNKNQMRKEYVWSMMFMGVAYVSAGMFMWEQLLVEANSPKAIGLLMVTAMAVITSLIQRVLGELKEIKEFELLKVKVEGGRHEKR